MPLYIETVKSLVINILTLHFELHDCTIIINNTVRHFRTFSVLTYTVAEMRSFPVVTAADQLQKYLKIDLCHVLSV